MHSGKKIWGRSDLLSTLKSWSSPSNWSRNLHKLIYKFNMTLPVQFEHVDLPVVWNNQHVIFPWPTLPFSSWLTAIFKRSHGEPILAGTKLKDDKVWKNTFNGFWNKFKEARGDGHQVFQDHLNDLEYCVPVAIHGDEGRGKLKRAVLASSIQPLIVPNGHAGHSFNTRYLHSILPGELYEGDTSCAVLQDVLVEDLKKLYNDGFTVSCCIHKFMHPFMQKINVPSCMYFHQAFARFTRMMEDLSNCSLFWSVWKEIGCICVPWFVVHAILWSCMHYDIDHVYINCWLCLCLASWCHATLRGKAHALSSGFTSLRKCHYCSSEVSSPTCFGTCRVCALVW